MAVTSKANMHHNMHQISTLSVAKTWSGSCMTMQHTAGAERAYRDAVTTVAEPMNDLAWLYLQSGRAKEATGPATLAVQMRPDEPRYLDTLDKVRAASQGGTLGHVAKPVGARAWTGA